MGEGSPEIRPLPNQEETGIEKQRES